MADSQTQAGQSQPTETQVADLAHKQKLECALKLTRTVALDFNKILVAEFYWQNFRHLPEI